MSPGELPFGSLPVLEVVGPRGTGRAAQTNAIRRLRRLRRRARPFDDAERALKVDQALDAGEDMFDLLGPSMAGQARQPAVEVSGSKPITTASAPTDSVRNG